MNSLMPFKTGHIVAEVIGDSGNSKLVVIARHDDVYCWTEEGRCYRRDDGGAKERDGVYRAIHTPGFKG